MSAEWLTVVAAAARVGKTRRTIYRWQAEGLVEIHSGYVRADDLVRAERSARARNPATKGTSLDVLARDLSVEPAALKDALRSLIEHRK